MGYTLEAVIIVPITILVIILIILNSCFLFLTISNESNAEFKSISFIHENKSIWQKSNTIYYEHNTVNISVNPVKIKKATDFLIDTTNELIGNFNIISDAGDFLNE